jgi:hypothetical protein
VIVWDMGIIGIGVWVIMGVVMRLDTCLPILNLHGTFSIITPHSAASTTNNSGMSHLVCSVFVARSRARVINDIVGCC